MHFPIELQQHQQQQQQQQLNKDYPQSQTPSSMSYPPSAQSPPHQHSYSSGYGAFDYPPHFNATTYALHQQQQQQQQQQHFDNTYNGRLIGVSTPGNGSSNAAVGPLSSFYSNRARYLPYQQPLPPAHHPMRGMYTPAGQQLIPSSVLHYPPRGTAYQQNALPLQPQRPLMHPQYTLAQHTQPQAQPQLRQQIQQQPQSQSQPPLHRTIPFGGNEPQMRHYADTANTAQATRFTPHLIMHLNGGASPPATATATATATAIPAPTPPLVPTPTPPPQSLAQPPSVDCSAYMQLQRQQHMQLQQQYPLEHLPSPPNLSISQAACHDARSQSALQCTMLPQRSPLVKILSASSTSSELPTINEDAQVRPRECREEEEQQPSHSLSHGTGSSCASSATNLAHMCTVSSPRLTVSSSDCLTTSPPLISATGTDSGISVSSCSTRARSDSTQSTPVYNGEYPMSVGSSSGVSYHCADIKDFEEFGREKEEQSACSALNENENWNLKQETLEGEINEERLKGDTADGVNTSTFNVKEKCVGKLVSASESAVEMKTKQTGDENEKDDAEDNASSCELGVRPANSSSPLDSTKHLPVNSPAAECSGVKSPEPNSAQKPVDSFRLDAHVSPSTNAESKTESNESTESQELQQQHKQKVLEKIAHHTGNTRTSFPNTDQTCWASSLNSSQYSPHFERSLLRQPELPSPPVPPAPPQNSPVDYFPATNTSPMGAFAYTALPATALKPSTTAAAAAAAAAVAAAAAAAAASIRTNKNRINESDLIPSKKSKRKTHQMPGKRQTDTEGGEAGAGGKDKRDMTPLPGFQQAFGSTEIGRFFETFLLSPPDCHSFNDSCDAFDVEEQLQQIHQQQQQQHQLQMQQEQQQLQLNQMHQQQQQLQQHQQYTPHDYFNRRYSDNNNYHHTQRLHPHYPQPHLHPSHPYYRGQAHPQYQIPGGNSYRDLWLYGRRAPSPYDLPYEYGGTRAASGSPASPYEMPLSARSPYGPSYDRLGYSYGRMNGSFSGIRCNGY